MNNSIAEDSLKVLLKTKRLLLLENLSMIDVVDNLIQDEILDLDQHQEVMAENTRRKKVAKFLEILPMLPNKYNAFGSLCSVLNEKKYNWMVEELREAAQQYSVSSLDVDKHMTEHRTPPDTSGKSVILITQDGI